MTEILLFHHAQGLTPGVVTFADQLRAAGHAVHTPDLYDGKTFDTLDEGIAHVEEIGADTIIARGVAAADGRPADLVYAGISLGVMPAQKLTQTRPGAKAALFIAATVPPAFFGEWPSGVTVQIHGKDADPFFVGEGDIDAARALERTAAAELFLYPGSQHLFTDNSLPDYDADATALVNQRVLSFLESLSE
jgi:dienelactone hydrolase